MTATNTDQASENPPNDQQGQFYTLFVDGEEFHVEQDSMTCGEIMDLADIPRDLGLLRIKEDGTEVKCPEDEVIEFEGPGRRLKTAPRFKRG